MGFDSLAESTVEDVVTRDTVAHLIRAPTLSSDAFGFGFRGTPNETVKGLGFRTQPRTPKATVYSSNGKTLKSFQGLPPPPSHPNTRNPRLRP